MSPHDSRSIDVVGIGKRYRIGRRERPNTLRDAISSVGRGLVRRRARDHTDFWALRNVTFDVGVGEAVGIIGRNGAGKSTLLKVLSRITEPTTGTACIRGRVGSLLEVGTGFHSELTGRENVFLSGAILGMRHAEIQRKFDAIIDFAGVEPFIDTPVKHFSSGMYLRLAFAVAAYLEPEILIVDEVLAVGDAEFQRKCIAKMQSLTQDAGRTVLFVSHDMRAIRRLCKRAIHLEAGRVRAEGGAAEVVHSYLAAGGPSTMPGVRTPLPRTQNGPRAAFRAATVLNPAGPPHHAITTDGPVEFLLEIEATAAFRAGSLAATFYDLGGVKLVNADLYCTGRSIELTPGRNLVRVRIDSLHLQPGLYPVGLWLADADGEVLDHREQALLIDVVRPAGVFRLVPAHDGVVSCELSVVVDPAKGGGDSR
jgi:lipopolysaccharide transport system ATP-binding protein